MPSPDVADPGPDWFRSLLDTADEVYFRFALEPAREFVYLSPSVRALTGHPPDAFRNDLALCLSLILRDDRRILRQALRARRGFGAVVRVVRDGTVVPVELRTVAVIRARRVAAIEGVVRPIARVGVSATALAATSPAQPDPPEPSPQRLAALMYEVHELLHRVLPSGATRLGDPTHRVRVGALTFDLERLSVFEDGRPVALTSRELMVLRYLVLRPGRVVTRAQLLTEVWGYRYTGDDRTVDVHISRLRRKLPSLGGRLVAIKHVGYRLDADDERLQVANS